MHAEGVDEPWPIPCAIEDGKPFFAWISAMDTMDIVLRPLFGESRGVSGYISLLMVDGMIRWTSCYLLRDHVRKQQNDNNNTHQ